MTKLERARIERAAAQIAAEKEREERLLWGLSCTFAMSTSPSEVAIETADLVIAEWRKRYL